jgi:pyruvate,water dikinase
MIDRVVWLSELTRSDVSRVGGKNTSIGEMIQYLTGSGIRVPEGFATTADAYWEFLDANGMRDRIAEHIDRLHEGADLGEVDQAIRKLFLEEQPAS